MQKMRLNHAELTVPIGTLTDNVRAEMAKFFETIFGWTSTDQPLAPVPSIMFWLDYPTEFIMCSENDPPLVSPDHDHVGLVVDNRQEWESIYSRCVEYQRADASVQLKEFDPLVWDGTTTYYFHVKHHLPLWLDVQAVEHADTVTSSWTYS